MKCPECGGSDFQGTCTCSYDYPPEQIVSHQTSDNILYAGRLPYETVESPKDLKQICHFCGVDLFLCETDLDMRMCASCASLLNHKGCNVCVRCNVAWLVAGAGSVCALCKIL
ncbi:hypothetical protein LCGC14_1597610 [marine sediment metagenome]|uniref:Uncharacterized protein n=1 Tax=marine sediment metagenome TaxID=412755 RepID=A0A0F9KSS9_9ZZZZ